MDCLDASVAVDLVEGRLDRDRVSAIEAHVASCSDCRTLIAAVVRRTDTDRDEDSELGAGATAGPVVLGRGAVVGRYVVLEPHGRGGMGDVYKAYDPELDRTVAIKLVRPGRAGADARARLIREARALAQLSHPNVVAVHDAGSFDDDVFIAMEFVTGRTLRAWVRTERPSWRRIVDTMIAAGRGLCAAHDAGLVHRDFKPDNVIVGDDGRVRVLDFGLVRSETGEDAAEAPTDPGGGGRPVDPATITRTGAVIGTPGYMAPEQHRGGEVDARSDQFSFCVVLHEALYGARPFPDVGLAEAVLAGRVVEPPHDAAVPARLRRIVLRGLSVAPGDRYPALAELLADLARDPAARRRRIAVVVGAAGLAGAAAVAATASLTGGAPPGPPPCRGAEAALAGTWDPGRRSAIERAFRTADPRLGAEAFAHAAPVLDGYAARWRAMHVDACEATRVRGDQSADVLDLRMRCLDRHRKALAAVVDVLAGADAALVGRAVQVAGALPPVAECGDIEALSTPLPLPRDPAVRAAVARVDAEIARVEALRLARRLPEGEAAARLMVEHAAKIRYPPVQAEALARQAIMFSTASKLDDAERVGERAVYAAIAARDPRTAVRAAVELAWDLGVAADHRVEAHRWGKLAEALVAGMGGSEELEELIDGTLGSMALYESDDAEAMRRLTRALELERKLDGGDSIYVARDLTNLAIVYYNRSDYQRSGQLLRDAIAMFDRTAGPHNSIAMEALQNLAELDVELGNYDEAEALAKRSYHLAVAIYGELSAEAARALGPAMMAHDARGDHETAAAEGRRRIAAFEHASPGGGELGVAWQMLGDVETHAGRDAAAVADYDRAIALILKAYGPRSHDLASTYVDVSVPLSRLGRHAEALRRARAGREILHGLLGDDNEATAEAEVAIARVELAAGDRAAARRRLEAALAVEVEAHAPASRQREAEDLLARARATP